MVSDNYLTRLAMIESSNNPRAQNPNSSAKGLYQFIDSTAQQYGLQDPFDPVQATDAAKRLTQDNRNALAKALQREPTEGELYLAHQQGANGALKLLSDPNAQAINTVGADAIRLNGGNDSMTNQDFANKWITKFEGDGLTPEEMAELEELEALEAQELSPEEMAELEQYEALEAQGAQEAPEQKESLKRTLFDQGLQGATFGFADEVSDVVGAAIATPFTDQSFGDLHSDARALTKERQDRQFEQRPIASIGAQAAGGIATGAAGAATKLGGRAANSLRGGNLGARIAKGSATGALSGAAYGAGTAQDGERLDGARSGGIGGAVLGGAIPSVGALARRAIPSKNPVTSETIKIQAQEAYKRAESVGGTLKTELTDNFLSKLDDFKPQTEAGRLLGGDSASTKIIDRLKGLNGRELTLDAVQEIDEFLGEAIDSQMELGRLNKQGKKLMDVQNAFRGLIEDASVNDIKGGKEGFEALKEGRKLWSQSLKLRDVERIIQRAEMTDNPATAIKSGFRTLADNPKRMRGFSPEEQKLIKKAAQSGVITDGLRTLGSRLIPIGVGVSNAGLGTTAAAAAASTASRGAASRVQLSKANKLARAISGGQQKALPDQTKQKILMDALLSGNAGQGSYNLINQ